MFTGNASTFLNFFKFPTDGETAEKTPFLKDPGFIPDLLSYQKRSFFYSNTFLFKINPQDTAVQEALSHRNQYQDHHLPYLRFPMKSS